MTKLDLHMHSRVSRIIGDSIGWISDEETLLRIRNSGVKIISFTDHDIFSTSFFLKINEINKRMNLGLIIYPGFELTVSRKNGKRGHIVFILNNDLKKEQLKEIEMILSQIKLSSQYGIRIEKAIELFKNYDFFIVPHVDKVDSIVYEDVSKVIDIIHYVEADENSREYIKFCKESHTKPLGIKFSDNHMWNSDVYKWTGCYIDDYESFDDLKYRIQFQKGAKC